jgi:hypothetical protein
MPFTTMSNYNWLFDVDLASHQNQVEPSLMQDAFGHSQLAVDASTGQSLVDYPGPNPSEPAAPGDLDAIRDKSSMPTNQSEPSYTGAPNGHVISPPFTDFHSRSNYSFDRLPHFSTSSKSISSTRTRGLHNSINEKHSLPTEASVLVPSDMERPMSMLQRSRSLPVIDEIARAQILDLIDVSQPMTPDTSYITRDHPLLSLSSLQTYCDLYFTRFNTAYPLIHQATFDASHVETLLLVSVLLVGATYCEKDAHQLAVCMLPLILRLHMLTITGMHP